MTLLFLFRPNLHVDNSVFVGKLSPNFGVNGNFLRFYLVPLLCNGGTHAHYFLSVCVGVGGGGGDGSNFCLIVDFIFFRFSNISAVCSRSN